MVFLAQTSWSDLSILQIDFSATKYLAPHGSDILVESTCSHAHVMFTFILIQLLHFTAYISQATTSFASQHKPSHTFGIVGISFYYDYQLLIPVMLCQAWLTIYTILHSDQ